MIASCPLAYQLFRAGFWSSRRKINAFVPPHIQPKGGTSVNKALITGSSSSWPTVAHPAALGVVILLAYRICGCRFMVAKHVLVHVGGSTRKTISVTSS
jgi:hypothetical protein